MLSLAFDKIKAFSKLFFFVFQTRVQASTLSFPEIIAKLPQIGVQGLYRGSIPAILGQFSRLSLSLSPPSSHMHRHNKKNKYKQKVFCPFDVLLPLWLMCSSDVVVMACEPEYLKQVN